MYINISGISADNRIRSLIKDHKSFLETSRKKISFTSQPRVTGTFKNRQIQYGVSISYQGGIPILSKGGPEKFDFFLKVKLLKLHNLPFYMKNFKFNYHDEFTIEHGWLTKYKLITTSRFLESINKIENKYLSNTEEDLKKLINIAEKIEVGVIDLSERIKKASQAALVDFTVKALFIIISIIYLSSLIYISY